MERLEFKTRIAAEKQQVWNTMLQPDTYKEWVAESWPGSFFEGKWEKGANLKFISPGQGGTMATLLECTPYEYVLAEHIAVITPDGTEDRESDIAKGWIGTTESYTFNERNGETELTVEIHTPREWAAMFNDGWPKALDKLKEICENKYAVHE